MESWFLFLVTAVWMLAVQVGITKLAGSSCFKGGKDRVVMLPRSLAPALRMQYSRHVVSGKQINKPCEAAWKHRTRWSKNILRLAAVGLGFGCFLPPCFLLTRAAASSGAIIYTKIACNVR